MRKIFGLRYDERLTKQVKGWLRVPTTIHEIDELGAERSIEFTAKGAGMYVSVSLPDGTEMCLAFDRQAFAYAVMNELSEALVH